MTSTDSFPEKLKRLTELAYLTAIGTSLVLEIDPRSAEETLSWRLQDLCTDGRKIGRVGLKVIQVKRRRPELPSFSADLLLVGLEALIHRYLAQRAGYSASDEAPSLEALVSASTIGADSWWKRDLVLLAEVRNAIVHGTGAVFLPNQRLSDAGWTDAVLAKEPVLMKRAFSDFLRFKGCVRTAANKLYPPSTVP